MFRHPARNAFPNLQSNIPQRFGRRPHRNREVEFILLLVHHQQRPRVGAEVFRHFFHDGLQDRIEVQRRRERFRHVVKNIELLALAG